MRALEPLGGRIKQFQFVDKACRHGKVTETRDSSLAPKIEEATT